ncbi:MAG: hypothetical protein ACFFCT_04210 [Candidatus Odinarchaeota archaeon]
MVFECVCLETVMIMPVQDAGRKVTTGWDRTYIIHMHSMIELMMIMIQQTILMTG